MQHSWIKIVVRIVFLSILTLTFLYGCTDSKTNYKEITEENGVSNSDSLVITNNWGIEKINYYSLQCEDIKLGVIDTGNNYYSENVTNLSVFGDDQITNDIIGHGTFLISNLSYLLPKTPIVSINVADETGTITMESIVKGVDLAISIGCNVINISLGTETDDPSLRSVIEKAVEYGVVIIAAAGNNQKNVLDYPAQYENVVSVIARNPDNVDDVSNNLCNEKKSCSAPSFIVLNDSYIFNGSSIATSYVSALVVYLLHINPQLNPERIIFILEKSSVYSTDYSYGMINFERALSLLDV